MTMNTSLNQQNPGGDGQRPVSDVAIVVPFIVENDQQGEILRTCVERLHENLRNPETELTLIDNGSPDPDYVMDCGIHSVPPVRNEENIGVIGTFKQGYEATNSDIVAFIHSDALLQEAGWDLRILDAFAADPQLGLAGLFGAQGIAADGCRLETMSNMVGKEWGKCPCHPVSWMHHGHHMTGVAPAAVLDGVGLFFRRDTLRQLVQETDMFADWRAPHHFYDLILSCKVAELGWHIATIGIEFDHFAGATVASEVYSRSAAAWVERQVGAGVLTDVRYGEIPDQTIYYIAEKQFFAEFRQRLPLFVNPDYSYRWGQ